MAEDALPYYDVIGICIDDANPHDLAEIFIDDCAWELKADSTPFTVLETAACLYTKISID